MATTITTTAAGIANGSAIQGFENLELRRHFDVSPTGASIALNNDGLVTVTGTDHAETITFSRAAHHRRTVLRVNVDGFEENYRVAVVKQIEVDANGGNDMVRLAGQIHVPSSLMGGDGNDTLSGGNANDTI